MAVTFVPVGVYTNLTNATSANAKTEINALVDVFLALLPDSSAKTSGGSPDYDAIRPELEQNIRAELTALKAAITNGA